MGIREERISRMMGRMKDSVTVRIFMNGSSSSEQEGDLRYTFLLAWHGMGVVL